MDTTSLYSAMLHVHSVGRWIVLLLLLFAIINSLIAGNRPYIRTDNRLGLLLTIAADLMLLIGIYLWFAGAWGYKQIENAGVSALMKNRPTGFIAIEHAVGMLIAIILIHIGKSQGRKAIGDRAKHRRTMIFYLLALLIILASIPWPFLQVGQQPVQRGWY
jgi:L-asparagine transporter-like permease